MFKGSKVERWKSLKVRGTKILSAFLTFLTFQLFVGGCAGNPVTVMPLRAIPANAVHPVWSPDGNSLAFESDLAGNWDIWMVNRDGTGLKQITHDSSNERFPSWSPDGARLAYASDRNGNWDIWSMKLDGADVRQLTQYNGLDIAPVWSPDGKRIAFVSSRSMDVLVWVMDADGGNVQGMPNIRCGDWVSAWSPDARSVAAVSSMRGKSDIWLIDTQDRTIKQLTQKTDTRRDFLPAWSPDGTRIAFVSERNGQRDIWIMDRDGSNERRIGKGVLGTRELKYNVDKQVFDGLSFLYLSWSPDGRDLAFTRVNEEGRGEIAVLQVAQQMK
jgi:Tol biopolymer transport system component